MLPDISAAFKILTRPMNTTVPARWVMKTWDIGLSRVSSVLQATGLLLFAFEVTFNADESNERCQRQYVSSLGKAFLPY